MRYIIRFNLLFLKYVDALLETAESVQADWNKFQSVIFVDL